MPKHLTNEQRAEREYQWTRRAVIAGLTWVALALMILVGVTYSEAASAPLTRAEARSVFLHAEPHGRFHGCTRRSLTTLFCRVDVRQVAVHEWQDPATGKWVEEGRIVYFVPARVPIYRGGVAWRDAEV